MKQRHWMVRLVWIDVVVGGLVVLLIYCAFNPSPAISSSEFSARFETARLLYEQDVVFSVGSFVLAATPFQLVYGVITAALLLLSLAVCLTRCLFTRYARHLFLPHIPAPKGKDSSRSEGYTAER